MKPKTQPKLKKYDFVIEEIKVRPLVPSVTMKLTIPMMENLFTSHFFYIVRPYVDEERIKRDINRKYHKLMEETIFTEEMQKQKEKEMEVAIAAEVARINALPNAVAFQANILEVKNKVSSSIVLELPNDELTVWLYKNHESLKEMQLVIWDPHSRYITDNQSAKDLILQEDPNTQFYWVLH